MRIIIDCNVLISAGLKDGLCRALLRRVVEEHEIYLSREVLLEYLLVSRREKFKIYKEYLEKLIELLAEISTVIMPNPTKFNLPDRNDKKYIDLAVSVRADFLITGNLIHFPEEKYEMTEVISPRDFYDKFYKE